MKNIANCGSLNREKALRPNASEREAGFSSFLTGQEGRVSA